MADYKEMAQRWYSEVMSEGKAEVIDELCSPDWLDHNPLPGTTPDFAGLKDFVTQIRAAFPDLQVTADEMVGEGDRLERRTREAAGRRAEHRPEVGIELHPAERVDEGSGRPPIECREAAICNLIPARHRRAACSGAGPI